MWHKNNTWSAALNNWCRNMHVWCYILTAQMLFQFIVNPVLVWICMLSWSKFSVWKKMKHDPCFWKPLAWNLPVSCTWSQLKVVIKFGCLSPPTTFLYSVTWHSWLPWLFSNPKCFSHYIVNFLVWLTGVGADCQQSYYGLCDRQWRTSVWVC